MKKISNLLFLFFTSSILAQIPAIEIKGIKNHPVSISEVSFDTKIFGNLATTTATYVFFNNGSSDLEGGMTFPMPAGVSVSGYALDINGKLREAVPVSKEKAKEVFESISSRNIDPGIIEKVAGNNYRVRVYPIPANKTRTVQITFQQELKIINNKQQFFLNFANAINFKKFSLKVTYNQIDSKPEILENPNKNFIFENTKNQWFAEINKINFTPSSSLKINVSNKQSSKIILQPRIDGRYYFAANINTNVVLADKPKSSKIAIIWDNTLSAAKRNLEKEIEFLNFYFANNPNTTVQLELLNIAQEKAGTFTVQNGNWQELKKYLLNIKYDGGTDFSVLKESAEVDETLLFSDGISNFGDLSIVFEKPLNSICSSPSADFNLLNQIAFLSGGSFINLNDQSADEGFKNYKKQPLKLIGLKGLETEEVFPKIGSTVNNQFTLFGITPNNSGQLIAIFENNKQQFEITINFNDSTVQNNWDVSKKWAQRKIDFLEINPTVNRKSIKGLSENFGLVSKNTSLIVLESVDDYVKYKITPPIELMNDYNKIVEENKKNILNKRRQLLSKAFDKTKELQAWWNMDFEAKAKEINPVMVKQATNNKDNLSEEVVVTGYANALNKISKEEIGRDSQEGGKINLMDIESKEEYMINFKNLENAELVYQKYLELRPKYQFYIPFYFDVSKILFKNDKKLSLKVLSSLAELDIENEELYKTIFYLLKQRGYFQKELWITQKILEWRPFDSQSHRDYAMALLDNKRPQEALDVYKSLLYQEFNDEISLRDEGIEEILIMEINNILNLNKEVDSSNIDNRLKANLPVDVRVIINWNKDHTDIDLHIEDPMGEECFYSNNKTTAGGRLSNDFTDGFGPEQFLLKKASKGKYKIKTNYFGDRQLKLSGPTTIMVEVYLYYSDGRQERKIAVFQSQKTTKTDKNGKVIIGEFEF